MLTSQNLKGILVPVVTPFDQNGILDIGSFNDLTRYLISKGIHGLIVDGTFGEAPIMDIKELKLLVAIVRKAIDETRRIPLIVGVHSNETSSILKRMSQVKAFGADAALVVTPEGNYSEQILLKHFQALAQIDLPIILNDCSSKNKNNLNLSTLLQIMDMDHVIGLRESSGNLSHVFKISRSTKKPVLCGDDELLFASMCCGAQGGILPGANLDSDQFVRVFELFQAGNIEASHREFEQLLPLIEFLITEPNPIQIIKWLLTQRLHIRSDFLRRPGTDVNNLLVL